MNRRAFLRSLGLGAASVSLLSALPARAQWVVTDPGLTIQQVQSNAQSLFHQAQELATQANQYLTEINQYTLQIEQYENMVQNTINLPAGVMSQVQGVVNHAMGVVDNIALAYQKADAIAVSASNIDQQFQLRYPGYASFSGANGGFTGFNPGPADLPYAQRQNGTLDSIRGAMSATGVNVQDVQSELAAVQALQTMSASSVGGTVQAMQAAHQIALHQVDQINKLNGLISAQTQAQTTYYASQVQNQTDSRAAEGQFAQPVKDVW